MKKILGFTLIEVVIAIGILLLLSGIVLFAFGSMRGNYVLEGELQRVTSILKDARSRTISGKDDIQYGVHFASTSVTLFRGTVYNPNDLTNEVYVLDSRVSFGLVNLNGGILNTVFTKIKGTTDGYGTTTLNLVGNPSNYKTINIKPSGLVEI